MTPDASDEALRQLRLRYRLAGTAAQGYAEAGFTVVLEDLVAGPMLGEVPELFGVTPSQVIVLMGSREAIAARERARAAKGYGRWTIEELHDLFETGTPRIGSWIDTTALKPDETVERILDLLAR